MGNQMFIYTSDKETHDKLAKSTACVGKFNKNGETVYIFHNNGVFKFEDIDLTKISYSNKMCF